MGQLRQRGRVWWIRYYRAGARHEESSHSTKKQAAIDLLKIREGDVAKGLPITAKIGRFRFDEAAADLLVEYHVNNRRSVDELDRRISKHLLPYFTGRRMASITTSDVRSFIAHRQREGIVAVKGRRAGQRVGDVSNAEINRELQALKRIFSLAVQAEKILRRPHVPLLEERNTRTGFFELEQLHGVLGHLPAALQPVITFSFITGWRIASEVLPLEWRQVDFAAGEIRLEPETTKNRSARTFPLTDDLRALLQRQHAEHERLKAAGQVVPWVFFRLVAKGRRGPKKAKVITSFTKAWASACKAAGCPGRIPHDLRRTAVRNMVRRGVPERVAMALAGHKTRSVFDRYNVVSEGDLRTAGEQLANLTGTVQGQSGGNASAADSESSKLLRKFGGAARI